MLREVKPVNFHYFGKEQKSHFDHRICIRVFFLAVLASTLAVSRNSIIICMSRIGGLASVISFSKGLILLFPDFEK